MRVVYVRVFMSTSIIRSKTLQVLSVMQLIQQTQDNGGEQLVILLTGSLVLTIANYLAN